MDSLYTGLLSLAALFTSNAPVENRPIAPQPLAPKSFVRVVTGPEELRGKIMRIQGTIKEVLGVDDPYESEKSYRLPVLYNYVKGEYPASGTIYYARHTETDLKYCMHESWLQQEPNFTEDDLLTTFYGKTEDGRLFTKQVTVREWRKLEEEKLEKKCQAYNFDVFKKTYVDHYPHGIEKSQASLIQHAPEGIRNWFNDIREGKKPNPLLVYGAYGVGKSETPKAFVKSMGLILCDPSVAHMRFDWKPDPFKLEYLDALEGSVCVMLDNIGKLADDDVENMCNLIDFCNARKNMHLIAIAYHAKKNMPATLYAKFSSVIKFPLPTFEQKMALLKQAFVGWEMGVNVEEHDLKAIIDSLPHDSVRDILGFAHNARICSYDDGMPLSKKHLEEAMEQEIRSRTGIGLPEIPDECE